MLSAATETPRTPASSSTPDYLSSNPETPQITTYTQDSTLERDYEEITELNVPDVVGYTTAVEKGHIARVRSEEKDLYSVVFSNGDGTNTLYMFSDPVKFIDKDGKIKDKSNKIIPADGSSNYAYINGDNDIRVAFPTLLNDGVKLAYNDIDIIMKPKTQIESTVSLEAPGVKTVESEELVRYDNVFGENTYLTYKPEYMGFKEDIVVTEYTGQSEFEFTLYTGGLELYRDTTDSEGGSLYLRNSKGEIVASLGQVIIFTADNGNNSFGAYEFETVKENEEYTVTIKVDPDYLKDPKTVYPVTIDPTITINYTNNGSGAIEDVTLNSTTGSDGSSTVLTVGKHNTYGIRRTLMRFPALNLSGIYPEQITSANVYIRDLMAQQDPMYVYCHAFYGNSWSESTANWSNVNPNSYGSSMSSKNVYYDGSRIWYDFSILGAVKDWSHEKNTPGYSGSARLSKGVIFKANSTVENGSTYITKTFGSYNNGTTNYKPYLVLNYTNINYFNQNKVYQIINQGSGKYMQVDNKNLNVGGLAVLYGNSSESHIMWRFEMQSNGYCKIFPMHTNNLVLGVSTSGSIQTIEKTSTSDRALWKITKNSNGRYNIISKYFESVSNKYLAAQSSSYQIPTMHLSNLSADSLSEWNINAYNNDSIWDGEYTNFCGSIDGNPYQVYYTYDQNAWDVSVVDPWAVGTAGMTWNNISSNVNLIYDSPMYSYDDLPAGNNYFVIFRENNDLRNAIALTIPHFNNVPEPDTDSNWDFCIIECNLVKMAELTVAQRHAILVHELGHALKLSHPREITIEAYIPDFDYDYIENNNTPRQTINKLTFPSLMQPICGEQSIYNYLFQQISFDIINIGGIAYSCDGEYIYKEMSWSLTYYDKSALIQKWGE